MEKTGGTAAKRQRPFIVWFTGISGAGKSTISQTVDEMLTLRGKHTYMLDGDRLRRGLNSDLGFTEASRNENVRRVGELAALMADAGLIVLVACMSPFASQRAKARELVSEGDFFEVYVRTPLAIAEERDPKGLYRRFRRGEVKNLSGLDAPYEEPKNAELVIDTTVTLPNDAAQEVLGKLCLRGLL